MLCRSSKYLCELTFKEVERERALAESQIDTKMACMPVPLEPVTQAVTQARDRQAFIARCFLAAEACAASNAMHDLA